MPRLILALMVFNGVSAIVWSLVGACRFVGERARPGRRRARRGKQALTPEQAAVLVCAHNEEQSLPTCLAAATRIVPPHNIFVASDGSTDDTVRIARRWGCNVIDIQPNRGKASALKLLLDHFAVCERFEVALIADADARPDEDYLRHALPLFDDPEVVAVAGHAVPTWRRHRWPAWSMFFAAYRTRLYRITQAVLRYGQTWKYTNVNFIVPGFSSMYRCSALAQIDVAAPGLSVEDFNMTFEIHRKRLGTIAYTPRVRSTSQEAYGMADYCKQVRRWYLGLWQTVRRHGVWPSWFWLSLGVFLLEMVLQSFLFLALPFLLAWFLLQAGEPLAVWLPHAGAVDVSVLDVAIGVLLVDYALTVVVAAVDRMPMLAVYGLGFVLLRWIDGLLFLCTLPLAFLTRSDGRWESPARI